MPVLIVALVALGAFGAIGVLLAAAVILEQRAKHKEAGGTGSAVVPGKRAVQ